MKYGIVKSSRIYEGGPGYAGPTCEAASTVPGKIYDSKEEAEYVAARMSKCNIVGFTVEEYKAKEVANEDRTAEK